MSIKGIYINMDTTVIVKWKRSARIFFLSIAIGTLILFLGFGLFAKYENSFTSRLQMVLVMSGLGCMCSLIIAFLYVWAKLWRLEVKNDEVTISAFLKKKRHYSLSKLSIEDKRAGTCVKIDGKIIARTSPILENYEKFICVVRSAGGPVKIKTK